MSKMRKPTIYRVNGLSCANCAAKFEKNVKNIDGVTEAKVNFGAGTLSVCGDTSINQLEKAGAFENLKITSNQYYSNTPEQKKSIFKKNWHLIISLTFILLAIFSQNINGENSPTTVVLYLIAIIVGGFNLFKEGIFNLIKLDFTMESLMTVAIIGATIIGEWAEGAIVVILFALSEMLERYSMDKARQSIRSLMDIAPKEALIRRNDMEQMIAVSNIQIDDIMIIKPGQKIAMDGVIIKGYSVVNQAAITGESVPVEKKVDDEVFAGTLNEEGFLEVKVTKHIEDNTLSKIIHLVEEAQGERAPAQAFVDKFAKYYTPTIMMLALLVAIIPPLFLSGNWSTWIYQGLSLLVVGCPCSLVLSTPVSIVSAIGNSAKNGVLIKGGIYLEEIGGLQAIAFDKTGTLTKGKPVVTDFISYSEHDTKQKLLAKITALETLSQHPLASAIVSKSLVDNVDYKSIEINHFLSITGKGVRGDIDGVSYYIGSSKLFESSLKNSPSISQTYQSLQNQGKTAIIFGTESNILAIIAVTDEVREASKEIVAELHNLGITHTIMLTGDNNNTAQFIGKEILVSDIKAELMPEDKLSYIKELKQRHGKVAMIGDGVNDSPALAASTVGIAMGTSGTDTALETADVALMGDDLRKLPFIINLSRKTLKTIKQNITFSLGIKLLALLLVIPGWLTLWLAIIADMGATLLVTLNGLRLMKVKK